MTNPGRTNTVIALSRHKLTAAISSIILGGVLAQPALSADQPVNNSATALALNASDIDSVIVTGTRQLGTTARESASPIVSISADTLIESGKPNLIDELNKLEPSFYVPARSGDVGNLTRQIQIRDLGPNQTLVLINGKRRHQTAVVNASSTFAGATGVDLAQIPVSAIDHIEVLKDGAAAQYGTDAIAGVVNIILKNSPDSGSATIDYGSYGPSDINPQRDDKGQTKHVAINNGFGFGDEGFLNISAEWTDKEHTNNSGENPNIKSANVASPGWVNRIAGEPAYELYNVGFNAGIKLSDDVSLYGFGTAGHRDAVAQQNYRRYNSAPILFPTGYVPSIGISETDRALTAGLKGSFLGDGHWDLSTTYGTDEADVLVRNSANLNLIADTGTSPINFYNGTFINSQATTNFDLSKPVDVGIFAAPLNIAGGLEYRRETYELQPGDAASRYKAGSQAFPGYQITDARSEDRHVEGVYTEFSTRFTPDWQISFAGRYENYSEAGDTAIGKISTRFDFTSRFAVRATASTGFRAPTLAEQNFSATNVSPTVSNIQLAVNSPAAKLLGAPNLTPEESENLSLGFVFEPFQEVYASVDIYQIKLSDRIVNTGNLNGPAIKDAIAANGIQYQGSGANLSFFTNGVDTRTRGIDVAVDWTTDSKDYGSLKWNLTGTKINTDVTHIKNASAQLGGGLLITPVIVSGLEDSTPDYKVALGADYAIGKWNINARVTRYGTSSFLSSDAGTGLAPFTLNTITPKTLTDLSISYEFTNSLSGAIGANNIFDVRPNKTVPITRGSTNASIYPTFSPYPVDGAFYYARTTFRF
ncbi:MAG: TonB-dependent receptor [Gammaproteobacteria bacterium]|nr:MAG: TonB-dependent receptor [Gammaproteobacteria bacterium]